MNTPRRTVRISDDLWDRASELASENGETMSDVVRRGIEDYLRAAGVVVATVLVLLGLSACGGTDQQDAPSATQSAAADAPAAQVQEPAAEPSEAPVDCWTALPRSDPNSWSSQYNAMATDIYAAVAILDALPDPSEGCTAEDVASLESAKSLSVRIHEAPDFQPTTG